MMSAQALPITRREFAYFFFVASLIVATVMMLGAFVWAATPPLLFDLGPVDGFPADRPTPRYITLESGETTSLWVVRDGDRMLVFDGRARAGRNSNCRYRWVPVNNRFEDPCSGFKWTMAGEQLTYLFWPDKKRVSYLHDLDQYPTVVEGGRLRVNLGRRVFGESNAEPPPHIHCDLYLSGYVDCHPLK